jgi:hypothetical protein
MFYEEGVKFACFQLGIEKMAGLGRMLKQLQVSYQGSPIARAEIQRMLAGGGIGAVGGGIAGGSMGDEGVSAGGAGLGALLGGIGGALGARSLGRLQEARIGKALKGRTDIPFGERSSMKARAMEQVIPRMPKLEAAPGAARGANVPKATEGVTLTAPAGGVPGQTNIPPELVNQMRAAGML